MKKADLVKLITDQDKRITEIINERREIYNLLNERIDSSRQEMEKLYYELKEQKEVIDVLLKKIDAMHTISGSDLAGILKRSGGTGNRSNDISFT